MPLKVYLDWISQPSRFVATVLDMLKVPYEVHEIRVFRGDNRSDDYRRVNPFQKVPAIDDDGYVLGESHAIVRYIIKSRQLHTDLYPLSDFKQCGKIDEYLDYHHGNTRKLTLYAYNLRAVPKLGLEPTCDLKIVSKEVSQILTFIDSQLLHKKEYIVGNSLTLADLSAFCEIIQLSLIEFDYTPYPNIQRWIRSMMQLKEVQKTHQFLFKVTQKEFPNYRL